MDPRRTRLTEFCTEYAEVCVCGEMAELVSTRGALVTVWVASWTITFSVVDALRPQWPNWLFCRFRKKSTVADSINNLVHRQTLEHFTEGKIISKCIVFSSFLLQFELCRIAHPACFGRLWVCRQNCWFGVSKMAVSPHPKWLNFIGCWLSISDSCWVKKYLERSREMSRKVLDPGIPGKHQRNSSKVSVTVRHLLFGVASAI